MELSEYSGWTAVSVWEEALEAAIQILKFEEIVV
jgi:hypothetical protein